MTMSIGAPSSQQLRHDHRGVAQDTDRQRPTGLLGLLGQPQRLVQRLRADVEVPVLDPPVDPGGVDVDADRDAVVHRDGQRLRAAHAAEARRSA